MGEKQYCIIAIEKIHSMSSLRTRYDHNFRELPLKHVDITKADLNRELVNETGADYSDLWYRRVKEVELATGKPVTVRKNAVLAYEIVTTFSREANIDVDEWAKLNVEWMKNTFGEDNILSMQLHEDEVTPHIHTIVVPIDERGKLCARSFTGGRSKMLQFQSSYSKAMEPLGLCRGERHSKTRHEKMGQFYARLNKIEDEKAPTMEPNERVDNYVARVNEYIQNIQMDSLWKEKKLKRAVEMEKTKHAQFYEKYSEAIKLQDDLDETFGGNSRLVKERLQTYRKIEKAVPRKTLGTLLTNLLAKFPLEENIRNFRQKKKRKKKEEVNIDTTL